MEEIDSKTDASWEVRRAGNADVEGVMNLLLQVNRVHHEGRPDLFRGPTTKYSAEELPGIFADDTRPVFVLVSGGKVLGYAFCLLQEHSGDRLLCDVRTLYIDDICVDSAARGMKVGSRLYERCLEHARDLGCHNVTLNVWALNPVAQKFYEKMGMKPQKTTMETIL